MKISENGLKLIRSFEGCRLEAYKCPAGVWTIGWGHTGNVKAGQRITQAEADKMLTDDMGPYERNVDKYGTKYMWNQNEFDALVSFAYNVGSIDQLTAKGTRSRAEISEKILAYNRGGGKTGRTEAIFNSNKRTKEKRMAARGWRLEVLPRKRGACKK